MSTSRSFAIVGACALAAVIAGCSDSGTGPKPQPQNIELMARFDSVLTGLDPNTQNVRSAQLFSLIAVLSVGAPVQSVDVTVDGTSRTYSAVGVYEVTDDIEGNPSDSAYVLVAWRGDRADSLFTFEVFGELGQAAFTTDDSAFTTLTAAGTVTAGTPNGTCTTYLDHLPPGFEPPTSLQCSLETATPSMDATLASAEDDSHTHHVVRPSQSVPGVRVEAQPGT